MKEMNFLRPYRYAYQGDSRVRGLVQWPLWKAFHNGQVQTVSVAAQFARKRSVRIDPFHRAHSWRRRDSDVM